MAAVGGDWAIHIYSLKCFKVGVGAAGATPLPSCHRAGEGGLGASDPSLGHCCDPRAGLGGVREEGSEVVLVASVTVLSPPALQHHCTVPTYSCAVTALAIHPVTNNLVIAYADQQVGAIPVEAPVATVPSPRLSLASGLPDRIAWLVMMLGRTKSHQPPPLPPLQLFEFSIPEQQYTAWSRMVQNCGLHRLWLERDTHITHITFNPKNPSHILLHDVYMFCVLDKSLVSLCALLGGLGLCPGCVPCPF